MKKYDHVRIPPGLNQTLEIFLKTDTARKLGMVSKIDVVAQAVRDLFTKYDFNPETPRLTHFNIYDDHVTIMDRELDHMVDVYLRDGNLLCGECRSDSCVHVAFAFGLKEVESKLDDAGSYSRIKSKLKDKGLIPIS